MTREEIIEKLKDVCKLALPSKTELVEKLTEESDLNTDMGLNSMSMLYVVIAIEEFFGIRFDDVSFGDFKTIKDVVDYIEEKKN